MKLLLFFHYFLEVFKNSFAMKTSSFVMKISLYANILQINVYIEETHTDPKKNRDRRVQMVCKHIKPIKWLTM